jgi:allantoinase
MSNEQINPHDRVPYSAIVDRPKLVLPNGKRMAVWFIVAVEDWDFNRPMPRTVLSPPAGNGAIPDVPNWAWHEYGNRVGFWRVKKLFDEFGIRPVLALNGIVCDTYPRIVSAAMESGWEFMAHGYLQRSMHMVEDQREAIRKSIEIIARTTGKKPRGWVGPGLTETYDTVDLLADEGIEYVADWVLDEQPCDIRTKTGRLVSIPYTQEINDVAMMLIQHHKASEYRDRAIDQFEQLYEDSADGARVMAIALHPYIMGVPHRAKHLRAVLEHITARKDVACMTGEEILDWYKGATA